MIRYVKIILAVFVSLLCLFYATQNVVNLEAAVAVVGAVLGMSGHEYYPAHFGPPVTSTALVWASVFVIILLEYVAGLLAARGAWDMWAARSAPAAVFQSSKKFLLAGAGVALIVWFGLFATIGGAYFQMWQTELGSDSLAGAFQFSAQIALVALYIRMDDDD